MRSETPRVLLLSGIGTRINPYLGLLTEGLVAAGAEVRTAPALTAGDLDPRSGPHAIHLHWLERLSLPAPIRLKGGLAGRALSRVLNAGAVYQVRRWWALARLFRQLGRYQRAGGRLAYTVHNLATHEEAGWAERWGAARILRQADVLHVHDDSTAMALAARTGRRTGVTVIPHGHYLTAYENRMSREEARARLGLPSGAFVYLALGLVRPYKGQEALLAAFRALPGDELRLVIAGQPQLECYAGSLSALAAGDARILLDFRLVPADEVQTYLNAADICTLPYRQITTSGAALLALSFGVPLVAPAIGAFPNLVRGRRGILYDPADPRGLSRALEAARRSDWTGARAENLAWVAQFDWPGIGSRLLGAYAIGERQRD